MPTLIWPTRSTTIPSKTRFVNQALKESLDIFANFFIDPLLTQDFVDKEVNAVNSEHEKNINNDAWREFQLMKHLSHKDSPFNCFSTGNLSTLKKDGLYDALRQHYNSKYSASIMNLVVYSNEQLDELEKTVAEIFKQVKNGDINDFKYNERPKAYTDHNTNKLIKVKTIKHEKKLKMIWTFDTMIPHFKANPFDVITHLIGHESTGSLLSFLRDHHLGHELYASHSNYADHFTKFEITVSLTEKGLENYEEVIDAIGLYLAMLRKEKIPEWLFQECKLMKNIKFDFQEKSDVLSKTLHVAQSISDFPVEYANILNYLLEEYTPDFYQSLLEQMKIEKSFVLLLNHDLADLPEREPIYKTEYSAEPIPAYLIKRFYHSEYSTDIAQKIQYPPRNNFIPKNFDLKLLPENPDKYPVNVWNSDPAEGELFFKQDDSFAVPKVILNFMFYFKEQNLGNDPSVQLSFHLWVDILKDFLREYLYLAEMANIKLALSPAVKGLHIKISGYNDSIEFFVSDLAKKINEFRKLARTEEGRKFLDTEFALKKQKLKQSLEKETKTEPFRLIMRSLNFILIDGMFSETDQLHALNLLQFDHYLSHHESILGEVYFEGLVMGNIVKDEAINLLKTFKESLAHEVGYAVMPREEIIDNKVSNLPESKTVILQRDIRTEKEKNNCILITYQFEQGWEHVYLFNFLNKYMENPFFEDLRTHQQLGYVVFSMNDCRKGVWAFNFLIQSDILTSSECALKIYEFLDKHRTLVKEIPDQQFENFRQAILTSYKQKYFNLGQESDAYFESIQRHTYKFNAKEIGIEKINAVTKEEFLALYEKIFFELKKVLEVHFVAHCSKEKNEAHLQERAQKDATIIRVANEKHLKKLLPSYPDLTMKF